MPVLAVIPARLGSTRFPQKPLQLLAGEPLVVRVARCVQGMGLVDRIVVATDAEAIAAAVAAAGFPVALTAAAHRSGTDRVAEVVAQAGFQDFDVIVNVQGDEPFLPPAALAGAIARVWAGDQIGTAAAPLAEADAGDPNRVKVVTDLAGRALYFSRSVIPAPGGPGPGSAYWQHLGIYAYGREALLQMAALEPTPLERAERLEQLRALENGMRIGVARLTEPVPAGIDTAEDLVRAERYWTQRQGSGS